MAANVVVIDSTFRRATIKVQPGTYMSDVLTEGCKKLNLRPESYGLKHNKKNLDLSLTWRLASLPSGAQLELVQASRSPSVVDVALQLPQSENNARLTDKFPSTTTFWQLLRRFESGAAGGANNLNITQRGVPELAGGASGAGRLNYEMPAIHVQGRELTTVEDLQKTLAQIGVNSGRVLIRLSFKNSGRPLEEAMTDISKYFKGTESETGPAATTATSPEGTSAQTQSEPTDDQEEPSTGSVAEPDAASAAGLSATNQVKDTNGTSSLPEPSVSSTQEAIEGPDSRPMLVYSAPTTNAPQASRFETTDSDFEPTMDHAKLHQARLNTESRNRRLPSEREIEEADKAKKERLASVTEVRIRVRLPDQTSVESTFTREEAASKLYDWVRSMMGLPEEPFTLRYVSSKGQSVSLPDGRERLIVDLGLTARTLTNFTWEEAASVKARQTPVLKEQWRKQAQAMQVAAPKQEVEMKISPSGYDNKPQPKKSSGADKEAKLKNLLGFGKKK